MVEADTAERIARIYRRFAETEAPGRSAVYAEISAKIAEDPEMIAFLAGMPPTKWQPNLFYGAVQYRTGPVRDWPGFRAAVAADGPEIRAVMSRRATQTNEPSRCATLLPALSALPQPIALIEVGASAGLCLLPDRYGYDYDQEGVARRIPGSLVFPCRANAATPVPDRAPEVVWRAGLDLDPLDPADPDDRAWLDALIWPGEEERRPRLHAALEIARADPPRVVRGDLRADLPALAAEAPRDATLVVFHTAVLAYLHQDVAGRRSFVDSVRATGAVWLANEVPQVLPGVDPDAVGVRPGDFVLARDGRPVARTDPHGTWVEWLTPAERARGWPAPSPFP
ncbi:MAG TPA: DUF2332 domain-containing protein [Amycolatopsis sp.]|jgi:hypothetical protein|nr:DUF2332 domain-containing protein [Amycolatopsis sp.]